MTISVIIPVYNAERFLRKAVESAVALPEVSEVILVEDGSPDNALAVCRQLVKESPKVRLLQHPGGVNRGAGASRNLGMANARSEFIAFLDADDWYLPHRFTESVEILQKDPTVDGVYAPVGTFFYGNSENFLGREMSKEQGERHITYFRKHIEPQDLFFEMLTMSNGTFHTDGILMKRTLPERAGNFNESLRLHQDSEMWIRCAYYGKLVGVSDKTPVALRGVHAANRIRHSNFRSKSALYQAVYNYFRNRPVSKRERAVIESKYIHYFPGRRFHDSVKPLQYMEKALCWLRVKLDRIAYSVHR